jgi:prepilin-type N-terminal cleavage/methylation domain-containing protein
VSRPRESAFTLVELCVVLLIVAVLLAGVSVPIAAQVQMRRHEDTRRLLDEAREALMGFAAANARLPCPASATSRGEESFAPGGDAANGQCSNFHDGFLPAAALGVAPLDDEGYLRDAWMTRANRVRYAVFGAGATVNGVANAFTRANGLQAATLAGLGAAPHFLILCASGGGLTATSCGPAANQLTRRAAFVLLSLGPDANAVPPPGSDAERNLDGDGVFVWHEASEAPGNAFDDVLTWVPVNVLASRLVAAGRLP